MKNQTIAQQLKIEKLPIYVESISKKSTYYEDSVGFWEKVAYKNGEVVYYENSKGYKDGESGEYELTVEKISKLILRVKDNK
jgi:hypothetical protein